jgi:protein-L-isoaspartate(D-aspartate) O-methyltransferase
MESPAPGDEENKIDALHQALVNKLKKDGTIFTPSVEAAFRAVPRHLFLPGVAPSEVYRDQAIATKSLNGMFVSSSSQPAIMAIMLELLELNPGQRVLEIGAGTGYNAALLAHIVGETGQVVTVDIDEDIVESARAHLTMAGFDKVQVVCGDGGLGYLSAAPFDRIILTVQAWDITPAWWEQLELGGRLLLPLSVIRGVQKLVAFERGDGSLVSVAVEDCGFITLRGAFAGPERYAQLGSEPGLYVSIEDRSLVDAEAVYRLLMGPTRDLPTSVRVTLREIWGGLSLWLALHEPNFCGLGAQGAVAERGIIPDLFGFSNKSSSTVGLLGEHGLCVLMPSSQKASKLPTQCIAADPSAFELSVRSFGSGDTLAQRLIEQITAWNAAGRPSNKGLYIRAFPLNTDYVPSENETTIPKRWTRLVLNWQ